VINRSWYALHPKTILAARNTDTLSKKGYKKENQMKKILFVVLALALMLASCGPSETTETSTESTEAVEVITEEPVVETEEPVAEQPTAETPAEVEPTDVPAVQEPKVLVTGLGQESWPVRGWTIETDDAFFLNGYGVCETLVWVDFDGNMVPQLATSWTMVDDFTWEFTLRTDVTFQNGEPFNAAAVVKSFQYITTSPTPPRGFSATTFSAVEAVDDVTVRIQTAAMDVLMPNRLTAPATCIWASAAYIAENGPIDPFGTGTGPFMLTDWVVDQSIQAVRNPNWWGGSAILDEVTFLYVPDAAVRAGMLQTGEINFSNNIPIEQIPVLEADSNITVIAAPETRTTTMHLNLSREPFSDVRVRQAVNYALDRQLIVDALLEGVGTPSIGVISPMEGWVNSDLAGFPYDPDQAIALLADAGYADGLTVSLWTYATRAILPPIAIAIQDMLADVGINVEVRVAQYDAMEPDVLSGNYDMFLMSRNHVLDTYDPEGFFTSDYACEGSFNMDLFCNEEFDTLLIEARTTADSTARFEIYRQLQTILEENAVGVFVHYNQRVVAYINNLLNFQNHPLGRFYINENIDVAP